MTVRTRFAPSPTGFMHVGNLRTGLFAYLAARHAGGSFILRLEDTDQKREVEGSSEHIRACLQMLGLEWDEGIDKGGPYAPYQQSQRLTHYRQWAEELISQGRAYADPYSQEEVQAFREEARTAKQPFLYRAHRPTDPPKWDGTQPLRFKSEPRSYTWNDEVMGELHTGPEVIDDFILMKSDGYPTYNFAHIVDDAEMKITHVIRGQEFLASTPNYLNLYEALGLPFPIFATMPHIMNEQGNKKLGKRDGARDVLDYIRCGYLPETLLSFIATLGWNDGTEQEVFTRQELIDAFSLSRVQTSGARFDEKRLLWMNGQCIRKLSLDELEKRVEHLWPAEATSSTVGYKRDVLTLAQDRLKTLNDLPLLSSFFFSTPVADLSLIDSNKQLAKLSAPTQVSLLSAALAALKQLERWDAATIQEALNALLSDLSSKPGVLFSIIRIATTWTPFSPELDKTLSLLGKQTTLERLHSAIDAIRARA